MKNIIYFGVILFSLVLSSPIQAQSKKKMKTNKASLVVNIKTKVVDERRKTYFWCRNNNK